MRSHLIIEDPESLRFFIAPDHAIVVGNPGKQMGWVCACGERLADDLECLVCGNKYVKVDSGLEKIGRQD